MPTNDDKITAYLSSWTLLVSQSPSLTTILKDLRTITNWLDQHPDCYQVLSHPESSPLQRLNITTELLHDQVAPLSLTFLMQLASNQDLTLLPDLVRHLEQKDAPDHSLQIQQGEVASPVLLDAERLQALEAAVSEHIQRKVKLTVVPTRQILGGLRIKVGDIVIDGTLDTWLDQAMEKLAR